MPMPATIASPPDAEIRLACAPRRPSGAYSARNAEALVHSPPADSP